MLNKILLRIEVFLFIPLYATSQSVVPLSGWKAHLPYQAGKRVTQNEDKIIFATDWSLLVLNKEDFSYDFLSKVDGLSDIGISQIKYDKFGDQLVIAYTNSNIDVVKGQNVVNLPNIKSSQAISGDRQITSIYNSGDGKAYFGTGFGLVELDLNSFSFGFTTFTDLKVNDVVSFQGSLYIATEDGIYKAPQNRQINLGDFNNWEHLEMDSGLPLVYFSTAFCVFEDALYASIDRSIMKSDENNIFQTIYENEDYQIEYMSAEGSHLICGLSGDQIPGMVLFFNEQGEYEVNGSRCIDRGTYAIEDQFGRIWYADEFNEFRMSETFGSDCQRLTFNSPFSHLTSDITISQNVVYIASGGVSDNFNVLSNRFGIYILDHGNWNNINESSNATIARNDLINFYKILSHPAKNLTYAGTYWGGLMELNRDNNSIVIYDQTNSSLGGVTGDEERERITGLAFDNDLNLWISNFLAAKPLAVLSAGGNWHSFSVNSDRQLTELIVDDFGYKWIAVFGNSGGILVYDSGENVEDPSDDRQKFFNPSNSELTTNLINALAVDHQGAVWAGTTEGPVVFDCGADVFSENCQGRRIKVLQDSIAAFLLADVEIRDIEIDGADRKWFGTRNGIFVQSNDGESEELRFTVDNSPLFANNIIDLAYNGETGEMFIATDKGVLSYRTLTTAAKRTHDNDVYAFPNPVRPEYSGPIAIRGLANNANVKITDINGILVFETQALGGQAIWDGKDSNGNRAATGVYLVFSSTTNNFFDPDSHVTKILFIR